MSTGRPKKGQLLYQNPAPTAWDFSGQLESEISISPEKMGLKKDKYKVGDVVRIALKSTLGNLHLKQRHRGKLAEISGLDRGPVSGLRIYLAYLEDTEIAVELYDTDIEPRVKEKLTIKRLLE